MSAQEKFKPSTETPIRLHKQMAGDPMGGGMIPSIAAIGATPLRSGPPAASGANIGTVASKAPGGAARRFTGAAPITGQIFTSRPRLKTL